MRLVVDTNVFLDVLLRRDGFFDESSAFFVHCRQHCDQILVSVMTLRDVQYIVSRIFHSQSEGRKAAVRSYQMASKVIYAESDDAIAALFDDEGDYEDNIMAEIAERNMADAIVTNDRSGFRNSKIPVFTPKEYNDIRNREEKRRT